ncbi:hypothetical protein JCM10914A_01530 [Paenibacillus sp. JCM 10914]|uniref:hypothetical protein n=1 Tax=Paenibacillus sp. JCM 10914 TaxID=1236974 RepID=UPI0003CC4EF0|nr:hypothetical protein [Paenibacillus sp. JCM 10914]GAE06922.1 hypothetical protein JCM10914_3115 [Paenibacillus sp. JCM 10914]
MNNKILGMFFIGLAAFLYGVRHITAAIYGSSSLSWSRELFESMLSYTGKGPLILSITSLIIGMFCLLGPSVRKWHEADLRRSNWNDLNTENSSKENS